MIDLEYWIGSVMYFVLFVVFLILWGLWFSSLHSLGRFWNYIVRLAKLAWGLLAVSLLHFFVLKSYVHEYLLSLVWIAAGGWLLWKLGKYAFQESSIWRSSLGSPLWNSSFGSSPENPTARAPGQSWSAPESAAWESHDDDYGFNTNHHDYYKFFDDDYESNTTHHDLDDKFNTIHHDRDEEFNTMHHDGDDDHGVNPATGLPMMSGYTDVGGNPYGWSNDD